MATATATRLQANRPYDHLYDRTYVSSHQNDYDRATNKAMFGYSNCVRVPDDQYLFSELPHYPRAGIQLKKTQDIPQHVDVQWHGPGEVGADAHNVSGSQRHKYFARPNKQMLSTLPHIVMYAMRAPAKTALPADGRGATMPEPKSKTVGTQSMYRESDAQTDPYTPEYFVPRGQVPEVLSLTNLTFNAGLPATELELAIIERTRQKRLFNQMLPPPTDEQCMEMRMQLMEAQEFRDWADRERQIRELQERRLVLLQQALEERDGRREKAQEDKVDRVRQKKEEERDRKLATCQRDRTKVLRKMQKERQSAENRQGGGPQKRDVITDYADTTSQVYAPLARNGHVPDYNTAKIEVQPADLQTFAGMVQLEQSLPPSLLRATDKHPKDTAKKKSSHMVRKELEMAAALKSAMESIKKELQAPAEVDTQPGIKGDVSVAPGAKKAMRNIIDRPDSPRLKEDVLPEEEEQDTAVLLLQRIIRGRAYQNQMFEGKEKRLDLINELRAAERYAETATTVEEKRYIDQLYEKAFEGALESAQGSVVSQTLDQLSKELLRFQEERRIAAMVKLAERDRQYRQAQESGRRQAEERLREREDEMFRQIMGVHQGTVDSYLEDVLTDTVEQAAQSRALTEARLKAAKINQVVDRLEATNEDPEVVVRELVHSFQLPHVQREVAKRRVEVESRRFAEAARGALDETYRRVEDEVGER